MKEQNEKTNFNGAGNVYADALTRASSLLNALMGEPLPSDLSAKVQAWFRSEASLEVKYAALQKLFDELEPNLTPDRYEYEQLAKIRALLDFPSGQPVRPPRRKFTLGRIAARAAAVLIPALIVAGVWWMERKSQAPLTVSDTTTTISTDSLGQRHVVLPDGSEVWINSSGKLAYNNDFSAERLVSLDGEAYFSVVKDPERPFRVQAQHLAVEVLGTQFEMSAWKDSLEARVSLVTGAVEVTSEGNAKHKLVPGDRLTYNNSTQRITVENSPAAGEWRKAWLAFDNTPLEQALQTIAAAFGRSVSIEEGVPQDVLVNLHFGNGMSLAQILEVLQEIAPGFDYRIDGNKIIVTSTQKR